MRQLTRRDLKEIQTVFLAFRNFQLKKQFSLQLFLYLGNYRESFYVCATQDEVKCISLYCIHSPVAEPQLDGSTPSKWGSVDLNGSIGPLRVLCLTSLQHALASYIATHATTRHIFDLHTRLQTKLFQL
ncbi:hypothetical protein PROFUN_00774 [Planoprotostelium fungivorum]|uniref:Uncharacterized protein n=1 Tax=Planoprotostelium fungivorum TaxID=1890364 RepID=A0A2P6NZY7_9EUKA|nr:hypothetical protein PROFUN_00774 [Planoprotostelium fungivorum]